MRRICVFCGSNVGGRPEYADAARRFGELLAGRGIGLVYGGGNIGLMGVLADAALGAMVRERFVKTKHRKLLRVADTPDRLLDQLLHAPPPAPVEKWLDDRG